MKQDVVDQLIEAFPNYADRQLLALPDGWKDLVIELFRDLHEIQKLSPGFMECDLPIKIIDVEWRFYPSDRHVLYVRPYLHHRHWTADMALRLVQVVSRFNEHAGQVCEVCGQASVGTLKYQDRRRQERLCHEHMEERRWS